MEQDVANAQSVVFHHPVAHHRSRYRIVLPVLFAAVALLALAGVVRADEPGEARARRVAAELVASRASLRGGVPGRPVLVRALPAGGEGYYVAPIKRGGGIVALVGVSADGRSWQWYSEGYRERAFPRVDRAAASRVLSSRGSRSRPFLGLTPSGQLYWTAEDADVLVDASGAGGRSVRPKAEVLRAATGLDARPGRYAGSEAADPPSAVQPSAMAGSLPDAKNIPMPHFYQMNSYYCGPAAVQMLFGMFGPHVYYQNDVAAAMNAKDWGDWKGAYADDLVRATRFSAASGARLRSSLRGYQERAVGYAPVSNFWSEGGTSDPDYAARYRDLKQLVNQGYPVLLLTWYDGNHRSGHFRIVKGYDDRAGEFIVHDPWYSAPYYGPNIHFRQSFLVDDLWTKYSRWGAVIAPWSLSATAPVTAEAGGGFTVSAQVRYAGPHPLENRSPVSSSQAVLTAPPGFAVERATQPLPAIDRSGTAQSVSWRVTAPEGYDGEAVFKVTARGRFAGKSTSYPSYADWVGGSATATVRLTGTAPTGAPRPVSVAPRRASTTPGVQTKLVAAYDDPEGTDDLRSVMVLVNGNVGPERALYAAYDPKADALRLRNAEGTAWLGPVTLGSAKVLDNGYARLDARNTTVRRESGRLVVSWAASLDVRASGKRRRIYLQAIDSTGAISGWRALGEWLVNRRAEMGLVYGPPGVLAPGALATLDGRYADPDGNVNIQAAHLLVNGGRTVAGGVWVRYDAAANKLYLRNDSNSGWLGPLAPGGSGSLENSRVRLAGRETRVERSGTTVYVRWGLRFRAPFSGRRYVVYGAALDRYAQNAAPGWVVSGAVTVSASPKALPLSPVVGRSLPKRAAKLTSAVSDADGAANIAEVRLLVGADAKGWRAIVARYDAAADRLYLRAADGAQWLGGLRPGAPGTISNRFVVLDAGNTRVRRTDGGRVEVDWSLSFSPAFSGATYPVSVQATDDVGVSSGYARAGAWTVNRPPVGSSLSPINGKSSAGAQVTFEAAYSDLDGAASLADADLIVNTAATGSEGMLVRYNVAENKLYLRRASGEGWQGGVAPGKAGTITNGYATLYPKATTVTRKGALLVVRWRVSFSVKMRDRELKQYLRARDRTNGATGDVRMGTWNVE